MTQTVIIRGQGQRDLAKRLIDAVPIDGVVRVSDPKRTLDQNARMWAMISDVSRAKPNGRMATPETWKALFMHACGHAVQFELGLDGQPFPVGFQSSKMTVSQMRDMIEFIYEYGSRHNVLWSEPERELA